MKAFQFIGLSALLCLVLLPQSVLAETKHNNDEAEVIVYLRVVGNGPHLLAPWDFDVEVTGADASPDEFEGNANGTRVRIDDNSFFEVKAERHNGYHATYSGKCSGRVDEDDEEKCFITQTQMLAGGALPSGPYYHAAAPAFFQPMQPPVTLVTSFVPASLPNTGFDPSLGPMALAFAVVFGLGALLIGYPYARKIVATIR